MITRTVEDNGWVVKSDAIELATARVFHTSLANQIDPWTLERVGVLADVYYPCALDALVEAERWVADVEARYLDALKSTRVQLKLAYKTLYGNSDR
jgi:hypothetical protein